MRADEKLTAFVELESAIRELRRIGLTVWRVFARLGVAKADLNQAEAPFAPLRFFASSGPAIPQI